MALGRALVVVYLRAAVRAVVAVFKALLLACRYPLACYLLAVALVALLLSAGRGTGGRACCLSHVSQIIGLGSVADKTACFCAITA